MREIGGDAFRPLTVPTIAQEHMDEKSSDREHFEDLDLSLLHEARAGRLVVDPVEARREFGDKLAARLKLNHDGTKVLWPQPADSPHDPQNVRDFVSVSVH
jgi:hypothetical protein